MELYYDDIVVKKKLLINAGLFRVKPNSINLIQGKNGSGKTLILKNIAQNPQNRTSNMVLLDQDNEVTLSNCSVLESVSMDDDTEKQKYISDKIKSLGFGDLLNLKNGKLSGGEQRIINILRSIFSDAQIILMDEPTNDLDFSMVEKLLMMLNELKKEKTFIIISHDDRVSKIADNIYQVINKELKQIVNRTVYENLEVLDECKNIGDKTNKKILKKIIPYNYINIVLVIVLASVIFIQAGEFKTIVEDYDDSYLPDNEIILCSIYSDELSSCGINSAIPLKVYSCLSTMDITKNLRAIQDIKEIQNKYNIELYEVHIDSTNQYTTYPLEYYSKYNDESINVIDYYIEKYYGDENNEINIDSSEYFCEVNENLNYVDSYKLNIERYNECINELNQNEKYIVSAEAVVFNEGYNSESFYNLKKANELGTHLVFAYSEKIKELSHQLSICVNVIKSLGVLLIAMLLLFIVNWGTVKLIMLNYKNLIYLLRNYGYDIITVENTMINRINNRIPLLFILLIFLIVLSVYFKNLQISQIKYIFCFSAIVFCSILYSIENREISRYIEKYFRWDSR